MPQFVPVSAGPDGQPAPPKSGLYVLLMRMGLATSLRVGALGEFLCAPGVYLYTGSARKNLPMRVARHLASPGKLRWHIDHLTTAPNLQLLGAVVVPTAPGLSECRLNRTVGDLVGNLAPMPRFGASDCTARCPAHLWYSQESLTPAHLADALRAEGHEGVLSLLPPGHPPE